MVFEEEAPAAAHAKRKRNRASKTREAELEQELESTLENVITGVVLTFDDISAGKRADLAARRYTENILKTIRDPFLILDSGLRVRSANPAFYELFQVSVEDTTGVRIYDLGNKQWDIPSVRQMLEHLLTKNREVKDFVVEHTFPRIGRRRMILNARLVEPAKEEDHSIFLSIEDHGEITNEGDSDEGSAAHP